MNRFSAMRALNFGFGLCFVASATLQYNDPDPIRWTALYLAAAAGCVAWHRQWKSIELCGLVGLGALIWSVLIAIDLPKGVDVPVAFADWNMKEMGSELVRELGGLILVIGWMTALCAAQWRRIKHQRDTTTD